MARRYRHKIKKETLSEFINSQLKEAEEQLKNDKTGACIKINSCLELAILFQSKEIKEKAKELRKECEVKGGVGFILVWARILIVILVLFLTAFIVVKIVDCLTSLYGG